MLTATLSRNISMVLVTVIGHSHVRDLRFFSEVNHNDEIVLPNGNIIQLEFCFISGATFLTFLENSEVLDTFAESNPDIVLIILGGNDLKKDVELVGIKKKCRTFYSLIKSKFPNSYIICTQIESRFIEPGDKYEKFGSPYSEHFSKISVYFNKWLNNQKFKDRLLCIRGPNRMDNKLYYRDSVHFNIDGLTKYFHFLSSVLIDMCVNRLSN